MKRPGEKETESWMQSSGEEESKDSIPNSAWKAAREKYKAKLEKVENKYADEIDNLKAENERLKLGGSKKLNRPTREEFENDDDPEASYIEAVTDWKLEKNSAAMVANSKKAESERAVQNHALEVSRNVDAHYERAIKLAEKSGISSDQYRSADQVVRESIEEIFPNSGDVITDNLIANLGDGSEKVFYNLGVSATRRAQLKKLLSEDRSGLKAAVFLGKLEAQLSAPTKRTTNAPKPPANVDGDKSPKNESTAWKKKYDAADKKGGIQARFDIRRQAKKSGVDVGNW